MYRSSSKTSWHPLYLGHTVAVLCLLARGRTNNASDNTVNNYEYEFLKATAVALSTSAPCVTLYSALLLLFLLLSTGILTALRLALARFAQGQQCAMGKLEGSKVWHWSAQLMSSLDVWKQRRCGRGQRRCCCHCDFRFRTVSAFFPGSSCVDFEVPQKRATHTHLHTQLQQQRVPALYTLSQCQLSGICTEKCCKCSTVPQFHAKPSRAAPRRAVAPQGILNPFAIWLCACGTEIYGKFLGFWVSSLHIPASRLGLA